MNPYLVAVLAIILCSHLLEQAAALLNLRSLDPELPSEFRDVFDRHRYARSQEYTRVTTRFAMVRDAVLTLLTLGFILAHGFNALDSLARQPGLPPMATGLLFIGLLLLLSGLVNLPFSAYATFVIEERFGFNRTSIRTFCGDILKSVLLAILLGTPLLAAVLWLFERGGAMAWLYCWGVLALFVVVVQFLAPVVIMPLFNRFTPLEDGPLRQMILDYVRKEGTPVRDIHTMDGSKRSTRANAFFTGLGRFRRIVFFDTLLARLSPHEILAVLAHEMGHLRLHHLPRMMGATLLQMGFMLYLLSLCIDNRLLFDAFGMEHLSIYASLVFFGFLYAPLSLLVSVALHHVARHHEFQADSYAVRTTGLGDALISGLKKLAAANLANLTPHPFAVALHYSHPPILERIRAIRRLESAQAGESGQKRPEVCALCGRQQDGASLRWDGQQGYLCPDCLDEVAACGCED
ncbi:M48 family metallopeptidase [Thermodesulfobacteriota bacterium B35]